MQSGGETGHNSRDFNTFLRTNNTGGGGEKEKACVQLCFDWMMLIGVQIVPKYDQYDVERYPIIFANVMRAEIRERNCSNKKQLNQ